MIRKIQMFVGLLAIVLVSSCNFTEEIHLQEDGSGKLSIKFDGSDMMEMGGEELAKTNEKAVDSIVSFKGILEEHKDSIAQLSPEDQAKLKRLEPFNLRMVMDPEKKEMLFDLFSDFKDISEVNNAFNTFQEASLLGPSSQQAPAPMPASEQATEVYYSFAKNKFTRTAKIVDEALFQKQLDSMQGAEMFLSGSSYTEVPLSQKVKSTTAEGATFSADGKTMIYQVDFLDLMKNPALLDLEVELEK